MSGFLRKACTIWMLLALAGCAPSVHKTEDKVPLVWPAAPAAPRIAYVETISRPDDLGITKGFLQRVADALFGGSDSRLVRPMAVLAVGPTLYVADPGAQGVHRFDTANGDYELLHTESGSLPSAVGLARGAAGEVYVTDSALASVSVIRPREHVISRVALSVPLRQPTGIAVDPANGRIYVVDTTAHDVKVFERNGKLAYSFGRRGAGDGEFNYPTLIWRTRQGKLYVTDAMNFRIQIFDDGGRYLGKFGQLGDGSGDHLRQKGVATDRYGHVYVVDALFNAVQIFDSAGRLLLAFGALGRERGEFWLPAGIYIGDDDLIYVADSYNSRVQVFRYIGGDA